MFKISGTKIIITRGDTGIFDLPIEDYILADGDTVYFTVKKSLASTEKIIQKVITTFNRNGSAQIELLSTDTDIDPGNYIYDVRVDLSGGIKDTIVGPSQFKILEGVS